MPRFSVPPVNSFVTHNRTSSRQNPSCILKINVLISRQYPVTLVHTRLPQVPLLDFGNQTDIVSLRYLLLSISDISVPEFRVEVVTNHNNLKISVPERHNSPIRV